MLAAERGHTGLVSLLLARGAVAGLANKVGWASITGSV